MLAAAPDKYQAIMAMAPASSLRGIARPPFTDLVIKCMRSKFPEKLADSVWDNTGLLLDNAPGDVATSLSTAHIVLLTNDLTRDVALEAIERGASIIITYHPIIFKPLRSLTLADPQQETLLRLARAGIAIYCPHTAVDAAEGGLNMWLASIITGDIQHGKMPTGIRALPPCEPVVGSSPATPIYRGVAGELARPMSLSNIIRRLAHDLSAPRNDVMRERRVMVARPRGPGFPTKLDDIPIRKFAVCAGSGGSVLASAKDAELWVTGDLGHHAALQATEEGRCIVTVFHSNSERQYLEKMMKPWLEGELRKKLPDAQVLISMIDQDPYQVVDVKMGPTGSTQERPF